MITRFCILTTLVFALFTGTLFAEETNPVLGKVGDFVLREADLDRVLSSQPPAVQKRFQDEPQQRFNLVREILTKKAIVAKAKKERFDKRPEIKEQLSYVYDSFITQEYIIKVVTADITVPEDDLKKYYQEHEKEFQIPEQVKVRHILIAVSKEVKPEEKEKSRAKAEGILQRLSKGEDFAKLAGEVSDDPISAPKGGVLATFTLGKTNSEEFEKAAFALKSGETSGIVASTYGFHIIKMDERLEKRNATFAETRDLIYSKLKSELEQKKVREFMEQATKDAGLEVFGEKNSASQDSGNNSQSNGNTGDIKK